MKLIVEELSDEYAVVTQIEDNTRANLPMMFIPKLTRKGDVIEIKIHHEETERRLKRIELLKSEVWQ